MGVFSSGNKAAKPTSGSTIIAAGTCIQGSLELSCNLHVDGEVKGDVHCDGTVSIGKKGSITGQVNASQFLISGFYDGVCEVELLEISRTGHVEGEIQAKELVVAKGGSFNGRCTDTSSDKQAEVPHLHLEVGQIGSKL